jgi:hypothetical protein
MDEFYGAQHESYLLQHLLYAKQSCNLMNYYTSPNCEECNIAGRNIIDIIIPFSMTRNFHDFHYNKNIVLFLPLLYNNIR